MPILNKSVAQFALAALLLTGCGNWNVKTGTSGISTSNDYDNETGDIIRQETDAYGQLTDCTVGKSSERRDLPTCNEVKQQRNAQADEGREVSDGLLDNKLSGSKLFVLPNGSKIRIKTSVKYNDEIKNEGERGGGELIINALILREAATLTVFENLFINNGAKIDFATQDADGFELDTFGMPLNIQAGQAQNIVFRKKFGTTTSDLVGMSLQLRRPIRSLREYQKIARLDVGFKP